MKYRNIFTAAGFIKHAKEKAEKKDGNLADASKELLQEIMFSNLLYYGTYVIVGLGILTVFGFTDWLGGPFVLAQVILFLLVGTLLLAAGGLWWLWRTIKRRVKNIASSHSNTERDNAMDATVIEGKISNPGD